ncbi:MAG: hypothetical protein M0P64_04395 [Candidatus Pacebacteria bacterium]|nr:hypothetical protein [Candidatus Paceibacterota bacterium]
MSIFWSVFLGIFLLVIVISYIILALLARREGGSAMPAALDDSGPNKTAAQKAALVLQQEAFTRSTKRIEKSVHFRQGLLSVLATLILVVFDSQPFIIAAAFCVCLAVWHFCSSRQIII